jgi:Family of unknown function (DUF6624)
VHHDVPVMDRCHRHAAVLDAFFDERELVILGIPRLRKGDRRFDEAFTEAEQHVIADGVPPMFTLRPALRHLERHGYRSTHLAKMVEAVDRANAELGRLVEGPEWVAPERVGWSGAFAAAALVGHADDAPDTRRVAIECMRSGVEYGTVEPRRYAHLVDRDAVMRGHDQYYGTIFVPVDGTPRAVWPMPPEHEIDRARQAINLPPLRYDRQRYEQGATPGPFLVPSTRRDTALLLARLTISYLRHGRATRRLFSQ